MMVSRVPLVCADTSVLSMCGMVESTARMVYKFFNDVVGAEFV
jgi:hypothetical protein